MYKRLAAFLILGLTIGASIILAGQVLAHNGVDDEDEIETSAPANSPAGDDTSSSSPASTKVTITNSIKKVEAIEVEDASGKAQPSSRVDDFSQKIVILQIKNGQLLELVKTRDAGGRESETTTNLKTDDVVSISGQDNAGQGSQLKIRFRQGHFELEQEGLVAISNFPVSIDPVNNTISIVTPAGLVAFHGLPVKAVQELSQKGLFTDLDKIELEDENAASNVAKPDDVDIKAAAKTAPVSEKLSLKLHAHKAVKFLGLIRLNPAVTIKLAPDTGNAAVTAQPWYLNIFGFLFSR